MSKSLLWCWLWWWEYTKEILIKIGHTGTGTDTEPKYTIAAVQHQSSTNTASGRLINWAAPQHIR